MQGLSRAERVPDSPLLPLCAEDVWVTASEDWFRAHLRHVAVRQPPNWRFKVITDADLVQAWLATAALGGAEIYDADAAEAYSRRSLSYLTLVDIAVPPTLLIIRLGVKAAPNKEMPNVLLEAIQHRTHEERPTWVWDQPSAPVVDTSHRCHSEDVVRTLSQWHRVTETRSRSTASRKQGEPRVSVSLSVEDVTPPPEPRVLSAAVLPRKEGTPPEHVSVGIETGYNFRTALDAMTSDDEMDSPAPAHHSKQKFPKRSARR